MTKLSYGDFEVEAESLPASSILALFNRGFAHILGNESSSRVAAHFKRKGPDGVEGVIPDSKSPEYVSAKRDAQKALFDAIVAGTLGESMRGPRKDPIEAEIERISRDELVVILVSQKFIEKSRKLPTDETVIKFADGDKTFGSLRLRYVAKHADRLHKAAQAEIDRKAREAAKREAGASKLAESSLDDILG